MRQDTRPALGRLAALAAAALLAASPAPARAQATPCPTTGTLQSLIDYGTVGCVIGDEIFASFGSTITATGFVTTLSASNIAYTLIGTGGNGHIHGFELSGAWFAPANGTLDHNLRYQVRTIDGAARITDFHLLQTGEDVFGVRPPTGFVRVAEDVCVGAPFLGGCANNGGTIRSVSTFYAEHPALYGPGNHEDTQAWWPAVGFLDVDKDIAVYGGNGGAVLSNVHQTVSQVPEPATVWLLGAGIGLLGTAMRVRRRRS